MKIIAKNPRARFDYEILEEVEAGMILLGHEVKSVREGHADLKGAYVSFISGKPVLKNATIQPYRYASNLAGYEPGRARVLLLKQKEIDRLQGASEEQGMTVLPLELRAGRTIKALLGLGRGRKKYDKRERIRKRDVEKRLKHGREI